MVLDLILQGFILVLQCLDLRGVLLHLLLEVVGRRLGLLGLDLQLLVLLAKCGVAVAARLRRLTFLRGLHWLLHGSLHRWGVAVGGRGRGRVGRRQLGGRGGRAGALRQPARGAVRVGVLLSEDLLLLVGQVVNLRERAVSALQHRGSRGHLVSNGTPNRHE